jgi:hypothetical protein
MYSFDHVFEDICLSQTSLDKCCKDVVWDFHDHAECEFLD